MAIAVHYFSSVAFQYRAKTAIPGSIQIKWDIRLFKTTKKMTAEVMRVLAVTYFAVSAHDVI